VRCRVGAGTWVNEQLAHENHIRGKQKAPSYRSLPAPLTGLLGGGPARPFRMHEPPFDHFPAQVWARVARRRLRNFSSWLRTGEDGRGYAPLREAVAEYLGSSRGVKCRPGQVVIVSGVQQALDLLSRFLLRPGDPVWMEDPGYFGATIAFRTAGAKIIPVPVDDHGLPVAEGRKLSAGARGVYLTPAHQFPLGATMTADRRVAILEWAREAGAFIIEDDYDSEYRFEGRPIPALQGMDSGANVIFIGTFSKLLFPSIRIGYMVLPEEFIDPLLAFRYGTDLRSATFDQAVLCDFIVEGHLGRHIRRMRELYAGRLAALLEGGARYLKGALDISNVRAGLYTAGLLRNGMSSQEAEKAAHAHGIETMGMHRFVLRRPDPRGITLGFAAFDEGTIRSALARLAAVLRA
jgi:GntR family transcriptional regulator/MocR family aminotransferase